MNILSLILTVICMVAYFGYDKQILPYGCLLILILMDDIGRLRESKN